MFSAVGGLEQSSKDKRVVLPYALLLIAIFPKPGWFEGAVSVRRHEAMQAAGINP